MSQHVARSESVNLKWPVFVGNLEPCSIRFHHNEFCCTLDIHLKVCQIYLGLSVSICKPKCDKTTRNKTNYKLGSNVTPRVQAAETLLQKHGSVALDLHALNSRNTNMQHIAASSSILTYDTTQ